MKLNLVTTSPASASAVYRINPFMELVGLPWRTVGNTVLPTGSSKNKEVFIYHRPCSDKTFAHFTIAKNMGYKTWVDFDDLVTDVPFTNPAHSIIAPLKSNIERMIVAADIVTVSTPGIKAAWQHLNSNIHVVPNALNDALYNINEAGHNATSARIMWRGSNYHTCDLQTYIIEFSRIARNHPNYQLCFFGQRPAATLLKTHKNTSHVPEVFGMQNYTRAMHQMKPVALIVPLAGSEFNRCKSNIAFIEATLCGAVCIAPPMPQWNVQGCMTYEGTDLAEAVKCAIESPSLRKIAHGLAKEYIADHLLLSKVNQQRKKLINSL